MLKKLRGYLLLFVYVVVIITVSYWLGQQAYNWMPVTATKEAQDVDRLFSFLVSLGSLVFLGVVGMIGHSIIFNSAAPDDYSEGHATRGDSRLEILWIGIPTALVLWISVQSWSVYQELNLEGLGHHMTNASISDPIQAQYVSYQAQTRSEIEEIKVIAKQWEWSFYYPQADFTSAELHLPVNKKTRLVFESKDVIHGFFIPQFRFKQDIIPNRTVEITFTPLQKGKYVLHDSQFSGTYFALMEADVYVEPQTNYDNWLKTADSDTSLLKTNLAAEEYGQSLQTAFKSNWDTVKPAMSAPVVASQRESRK